MTQYIPTHINIPANVPAAVQSFVDESVQLCQPDSVVWCNGSDAQQAHLIERGCSSGTFIKLNQEKLPDCYLHRSNPNDVARTEQQTFICTPTDDDAGPTNNHMNDKEAYVKLRGLLEGAMKGRVMYVLPFVMGPVGSPLAKVGVQLTDSVYVAVSMRIMTRLGTVAWEQLSQAAQVGLTPGVAIEFTKCLHSTLDCDPARRFICHFPFDNAIISVGSGYGGNALLGKKCMALRIASFLGKRQGWMAEHMLVMGVRDNTGQKTYVAAAFPSACGKTNFAMMIPPEKYIKQGWEVTTVGDDIAWMWVDDKGQLRAINPENGYFGVLPGTNFQTNPRAMACMAKGTIYTNVALLPDGDVWWEGKTKSPPDSAIDWEGNPWTPDCKSKAAHANSRFTAPMINNPVLDENATNPEGVPIKAIIFGGRRSSTIPIVYQAFNWIHGVYIGSTLGSETTAAATGQQGIVRRDPMAMHPFIGYNIRDYFVHWFRMRRRMSDCPRIFNVNWFRKDKDGRFVWPGFGENMRILKWIIDRSRGRAYAVETPLGWMPRASDIDLEGLDLDAKSFEAIESFDVEEYKSEILNHEDLFLKLAADLPKEMIFQRELLISRL